MQDSRLIELLRTFSAKDRRRFREYVHSPLLNKNRKVRRLCDYILEFAPAFDHPDLDKTRTYQIIFQEDGFQELRINNVISDLLQRLYDYLAFLKYESQPVLQKQLLVEELLDREIHGQVERMVRRYRQLREQEPDQSYAFFHKAHSYFELLDRYSLTKGRRGYDENLQHKNDALDQYYLCNKLRIACDMVSRNIVVQAGYKCHHLEELLRRYEADEQQLQSLPALQVYYKTYQMLTCDSSEGYYRELKALLANYMHLFPRRELNFLYRYVLNYAVRQINIGKGHYYRELLEVYKLLLDKEIIFENGYLTQWSYINIITAGIRLKEYTWTEQFIHRYKERLLPDERKNVYTYNLAAFYFEKRDYDKALQQLHDVEFTDTSYHLGAKIIQLKSFFELDETEAFFSLVEAFRKYILRNREISDYRKRANHHFLRLAQQIYQLRLEQDLLAPAIVQKKREQISRRLQQLSLIANKGWLLEVFERIGEE